METPRLASRALALATTLLVVASAAMAQVERVTMSVDGLA